MTQKGPKGPPSRGGNWAKKYAPGADLAGSQRRSADVSRGSLRSIAALGPLVLAHDRVMRGDRVPARSEFFLEKLRLYLSRSYWSEVRPGPQDRAGAGGKSASRGKKFQKKRATRGAIHCAIMKENETKKRPSLGRFLRFYSGSTSTDHFFSLFGVFPADFPPARRPARLELSYGRLK